MKKFFVLVFALVSVALAGRVEAQGVSRESFKEMFSLMGSVDFKVEQFREFVPYVQQMNPDIKAEEAMAKAEKYVNEGLLDDMIDVLLPYYSEFSEADCRELIAMMTSDKMKEPMARMNEFTQSGQAMIHQALMKSVGALAMGMTPESVKLEGVSDEFMKAFERYNRAVDFEGVVASALSSAIGTVKQSLQQMGQDMSIVDKMEQYIKDNVKAASCNAIAKVFSAADLDLFTEMYSTAAGQHCQAGNKAMAADAINFSQKISGKVMEAMTK